MQPHNPNLAHGIGVPSSVVRGTLYTKEALRRRIAYWERKRDQVINLMPTKGFTPEECDAALSQVDDFLEFYDDALEKLE